LKIDRGYPKDAGTGYIGKSWEFSLLSHPLVSPEASTLALFKETEEGIPATSHFFRSFSNQTDAHHPLATVINLGIRNQKKKERNPSEGRGYLQRSCLKCEINNSTTQPGDHFDFDSIAL